MKGILSLTFLLALFCMAGCVETTTYIFVYHPEEEHIWEFQCENTGEVIQYISPIQYDGIEEDDLCQPQK